MPKNKDIFVSQPWLPRLDDFVERLELMWHTKNVTNNGPLVRELEERLSSQLNVDYVITFSSGTAALLASLMALEVKGEVITTPFTFIATINAIALAGCKPVFADIDPSSLNIDPASVRDSITSNSVAIMPVHTYGAACDVDSIDRIAVENDLRVVYDAAHAFGADCHCGSLLSHGDMSVLSFHATKVFHTFEGGAVTTTSRDLKDRLQLIRNFGIVDETTITSLGFNGKMPEISAAMGLCQLEVIDQILERRREIDKKYRVALDKLPGVRMPNTLADRPKNASYFPVIIEDGCRVTRDELVELLQSRGIFPRRYFYPLVTQAGFVRQWTGDQLPATPVAARLAEQILCLPIYDGLEESDLDRITAIIRSAC